MPEGDGRPDHTVIAKVRASRRDGCAMGCAGCAGCALLKFSTFLIDRCPELIRIITCLGDVAQLGERCRRMAEAEGSTPFVSTH